MFARSTTSVASTQALPKDGILRIPRRSEVIVTVDSGTVLVTREGDLDDHVLETGMELRLPRRGVAVVWALEPSTLRIREAASDVPAPTGPRGRGAGHRVPRVARAA
jgi:hypothetical protein